MDAEQPGDTPQQQLAFQMVNFAADSGGVNNVIYVGSAAKTNQIQLQILLSAGSTTLQPGKLVDPGNLPPSAGGALFYLDLGSLALSAARFAQLDFTTKGWSYKLYAKDGLVGLTPTAATPLRAGTPLAITVAGLEIDTLPPNPSVSLYVNYFNVPGVTGAAGGTGAFGVNMQNAPSGKLDLHQVMQATLVNTQVVNSIDERRTATNTLTLVLSQTRGTPVNADAKTAFKVSFVYGKPGDVYGYGALTTAAQALDIVATAGDNVVGWGLTGDRSAQNPSWTLVPLAGAPIVGTGALGAASVIFGPVVTPYQPGPTVMQVSYTGVPGYEDGVFELLINKVAHVFIDGLTVQPDPSYFQHGKAQVTVSWTSSPGAALLLTQNFASFKVTGQQQYLATINAQDTAFTLRATGADAAADNTDVANASATTFPVINSFAGGPTEILSGSGGHDVKLAWVVDTPGQVALSSSVQGTIGTAFDPSDHTASHVAEAQMFVLKPATGTVLPAQTRALVVGGFTPVPASHDTGAVTGGAASSPTAPYVALTDTAGNQVLVLDTVQYSRITTVPVGQGPTAVAISADGSLLATANADGSVSLVAASLQGGVPAFGGQTAIKVGGTPRAVMPTPDGSRIYATVDVGAGKPGMLVVLSQGRNGYTVTDHATVGLAPRGLAIDASGSRVFVANSGDDTLTIVGIAVDGSLGQPSTVPLVTGGPTAVAITPDGRTLLAACSTAGTVMAIDASYPRSGARQSLTVGKNPVQISVTAAGAYAFVANGGDGTLAILDVWGGPMEATVVQKGLKVGTQPAGVALSPDGLEVVVPDAGAKSFAVVTLATYQPESLQTGMGSRPTSVAAAPDGSGALVWHDATLSSSDPPAPGLRYYVASSATSTSIFNDIAVVECVYSPNPAAKRAYAIGTGGPGLYSLDLSDPAKPTETEAKLPVAGMALGLAVGGDAETIFVVMTDRSRHYTLQVGTMAGTSWTSAQSIPLYTGTATAVAPVHVAATADGSRVFVVDAANNAFTALSWNAQSGAYEVTPTAIQLANPTGIALNPDGSAAYVLSSGAPESITVIDTGTLKARPVSLLQPYVNLRALAASPDGRRLYATDLSAGALRVLDPASFRVLQTIPLATDIGQAQGAAGVAVAPDGSRIYAVSTQSGTLSVLRQVPI